MNWKLLQCLVVFFFAIHLKAQTFPDKQKLDQAIDSIFGNSISAQSPGVAVSVIQNGEVITQKAFGLANLEHQTAFTPTTPMRLGYSGAREFMCAGLAIMEFEGLLDFEDKIFMYFPEMPEWSAEVTIQDLLNHSSGFDDEWATMLLMQADMNNRVDKEQLLALLYNQPAPQVEPGKGYMYSNSDFALLRMIMEKASKKSLPDYLHEKLFKPLGMSDTFMNDHLDQIIPGLADKYYGSGNYFKQIGIKTSPGGNYRMVTTSRDLEKWAIALSDSASIAARAISRLYQDARPIPVLSPEVHYTFGHEWHKIEGTELIKHGGVNQDFYMTRIPALGVSIVGLGNAHENMTKAMGLTNQWLDLKSATKEIIPPISAGKVEITNQELAKFAGRYLELNTEGHSSHLPNIRFYDIKQKEDSLHFYYRSYEYFTMIPVGDHLFEDPDFGTILQFSKAHPDSAMIMKAWALDGTTMSFVQVPSPAGITSDYLRRFTGEYHSKHLDFYCRIVLDPNGQLILRRPTISDKPLIPDGENRFLFEMDAGGDRWYVVAQFTENESGEVDGIDMQHVRMMHHRFDKLEK